MWRTAIESGRQPLINGPEGRRSVEIILAIYKAAETGKVVRLPLERDPVLKARQTPKPSRPKPSLPSRGAPSWPPSRRRPDAAAESAE